MFWDILAALVIFPALYVIWYTLRTAQNMTRATNHSDRIEVVIMAIAGMDSLISSLANSWPHEALSLARMGLCIACAFIAYRDPWHARPDSLPYAGHRR